MKKLPSVCLLLICCLTGFASGAFADASAELEASQRRLAEIQKQIEDSLRELRAKRSAAGSLADELARLDDELRRLENATRRSREELQEIEARIAKVQQELEESQAARLRLQNKVRQRLAVLYKSGEVGLAKVLLGATESPRVIAENHFYLSRMVRQDRQLVDDYRQRVIDLEKNLLELEQLRKKQVEVTERRRREQAVLARAGRQKRALLGEIKADETSLHKYVAELRAKAARLGELVNKLETDEEQIYTTTLAPFSEQKGRLLWPVDGRLRAGFGTSRHAELGTLIENNGLEIAVPAGTPVKAVWGGKVLYASPFRGYGKLMIIDHGEKYYSLYAQVAEFSKQSGDLVSPGETVARTGFEGRDFLYFEVRRSGKPLDPLPWLKSR
ncbi:MAG TPA: peptidoglycan DD-metalloendopeptidase family protein [Desulfuromonadales bacterium]|nr:peptidoglycan DD-metalloendopeptidase family protein [Desulfuromonadales bacterium]